MITVQPSKLSFIFFALGGVPYNCVNTLSQLSIIHIYVFFVFSRIICTKCFFCCAFFQQPVVTAVITVSICCCGCEIIVATIVLSRNYDVIMM